MPTRLDRLREIAATADDAVTVERAMDDGITLLEALPALLAVVDAARDDHDGCDQTRCSVCKALAALEEEA